VASDASWELGRFLLMMMPAAAGDEQHRHRYCLLTASGRKFVTLMQEVVDGVACPLQSLGLGMDGNAALLVADLFREYVRSILDLLLLEEEEEELVIPKKKKKKKTRRRKKEKKKKKNSSGTCGSSPCWSTAPPWCPCSRSWRGQRQRRDKWAA